MPKKLFQQQVITMTRSGHSFLADGLLFGDDMCRGQGICKIQVYLSCSSPCLNHTSVFVLACTTRKSWFDPVEQESAVKIECVWEGANEV